MTTAKNLFAVINQELVPFNQAYLHVSDLAIQRGYGIFDYFKVSKGHPFFLDEYLTRFEVSAHLMGLTIPYTKQALKEKIYELIKKNDFDESGVKMILTGGYSPDGYQPAAANLVITQQEFSLPAQEHYEKGIKIMTHEYVRELPEAKTINYTMGIRLIQKLKENNADDVLYHQHGFVSEFPRCNFFLVNKENTVVTPALNILPGITRKNVLHLASQEYFVETAEVSLEDIYNAKEAFLTSTTKRILPIVQINDRIIGDGGPGIITKNLLANLIKLEEKDRVENKN